MKITYKDIERAIEGRNFFLQYQPKLSMITGEVCGAEALLRYKTKEGKIIPPDEFIPVAEAAGIITRLSKHVFDLLIADLPRIVALNKNILVSFNASGQDFHNDDFTKHIVEYAEAKKYIKNIEVEVTESVLLDQDVAMMNLTQLSELGITLSMDDFGTGHSGLLELSKWPFSTVKIDRSFVNGIYTSAKNTEIIQAAIRMSHQLNMDIVAEGIEDEYTFLLLQKYGCKIGQGFWVSRPLGLEAFLLYLKRYIVKETFPVGVLYMAQLDHMQWKKTLIDSALHVHKKFHEQEQELKSVKGGTPQLKHTDCKLGKWYYGAQKSFGHLEEYRELEIPHKELHELGEKLLQAAFENCSSHKLRRLIKQISDKSMTIIELLQNLENHWVMYQHVKETYGYQKDVPAIQLVKKQHGVD